MLFKDFLLGLVESAFATHQHSVELSEGFRQIHYEKDDKGHLQYKKTTRMINGKAVETPHKTQHNLDDYLTDRTTLKTTVEIYEKDDEIHTGVSDGLFSKGVHIEVEMELSRQNPPEGVNVQRDRMNHDLKRSM